MLLVGLTGTPAYLAWAILIDAGMAIVLWNGRHAAGKGLPGGPSSRRR